MSSVFVDACYGKKTPHTPVWLMRQAGRSLAGYRRLRNRHSMLSLVRNPELAAQITLEPVRVLGVDAAILFSDIAVPLVESWIKLDIKDGAGPVLKRRISKPRDIAMLGALDVERRLEYVAETIAYAKAELDGIPLIGFAGAPFTLASYLIEGGPSKRFERVKAFMYSAPSAWHMLMEKLTGNAIAYLKFQAESGADAVQLFDSWAGCLSPADYKKFVLPHSKKIFSALRKTRVPRIHFGTQTAGFIKDFAGVDAEVIGVDWRVSLDEARKSAGKKSIQGNLDPAILKADKKIIGREVDRIFKEAGRARGFIFNVGHGVLPETPVENIKYLVDYVHSK